MTIRPRSYSVTHPHPPSRLSHHRLPPQFLPVAVWLSKKRAYAVRTSNFLMEEVCAANDSEDGRRCRVPSGPME